MHDAAGDELRRRLDGLLVVPDGARVSELDRLRTLPAKASARELTRELDRLSEVRAVAAGQVDVSGLPAGRVAALARYGLAAKAPALRQVPAPRRTAVLVATLRALESSAPDDVLLEVFVAQAALTTVMPTILSWLRTRTRDLETKVCRRDARGTVELDGTVVLVAECDGGVYYRASFRVHGADDDTSADAELVGRLRAGGFVGPEYERLERRLAGYGFQVTGAWVRSREVFARCAQKGIRGVFPPAPCEVWSQQDVEELVQDTVARALVVFERDALRGGGWRPDGGACLAIYFVGTCLFAFAEVYPRRRRSWQRRALAAAAEVQDHVLTVLTDVPDIAEILETDQTVVAVLEAIPDRRLRLAVYLSINGYTHAEIAEVLADGTTTRSVEGMLYRFRRQAVQDRDVDHDDQ